MILKKNSWQGGQAPGPPRFAGESTGSVGARGDLSQMSVFSALNKNPTGGAARGCSTLRLKGHGLIGVLTDGFML